MIKQVTTSLRNSNIELLRILCMLMVVVLHFNNNGANAGIVNMPQTLTTSLTWGFLVESLCIVAVNCFVLISGYFGISLKLRSLLKFYLQCFFVGIFSYVLYTLVAPVNMSLTLVLERFLAFTHNGWWFVVSYLGLMLLSPLLNRAVDDMSSKQLLISIASFALVVLYLGWYQQVEPTHGGCSLLNFVFIYLIGRYVGKWVSLNCIQRRRWYWLMGYLLCALSIFGLVMLRYHCEMSVRYVFDYNHPLVLTAALMLFLFFLSFTFQSKTVNWLASSVFTAYLLQEHVLFGHDYLYPHMRNYFQYVPEGYNIAALLMVSVVFVVISICIDKLLNLFTQPLLRLYDRVVKRFN